MTDTTVDYLQVGKTLYTYVYECRCCGRSTLTPFLDLNKQPLANAFHKDGDTLIQYPLIVNVCTMCWHSQLSIVVAPDDLFKHYLYVSGTSETLRDYFEWFAMWSLNEWNKINNNPRTCKVLDIACNDGSQLDSYKALGCNTYGVDPAENLVPIAAAKGHTVICDYWSEDFATKHSQPGYFDIIVAQNVFAHVHDIMTFLHGCKVVMNPRSLLFIQTSQSDIFNNGEFDTIYHEHLSFFSVNSMRTLCDRAGLVLNRVERTNIHGKSYVFIIGQKQILPTNVQDELTREHIEGREQLDTYIQFGKTALQTINNLTTQIQAYQLSGRKVVGYGAAAKGMTLLNAGGINLEYIVDDSILKQGLLTPGMDIPVVSSDVMKNDLIDNLVIVPLAWNFADEIYEKIKLLRPTHDDVFIKYFPKLELYK